MKLCSNNILTWIIQEINENDSDSVTIVCKGGETVSTSCVLLAAIAPYLAPIFNYTDSQDTVILMPDVESQALMKFLNWILATKSHKALATFSDKESFSDLNGIFWLRAKSRLVFPLKSDDRGNFMEDLIGLIKSESIYEEDSVSELIAQNHSDMDPLRLTEVMNPSSDLTNQGSEPTSPPPTTTERSRSGRLIIKRSPFDPEVKGGGSAKVKTENNKENIQDDLVLEGKIIKSKIKKEKPSPRKKRKLATKTKETASDDQKFDDDLETLNDDDNFDDNDDNYVPAAQESDAGGSNSEDNFDHDQVENKRKTDNTKRKKVKRRKKGEKVFLAKEDWPKDEAFLEAQEKLKAVLEDETNLDDPCVLWYEYHGYDPQTTKFSRVKPKLLCPKCSLSCPLNSKGQVFFHHIRSHKIRNYKCPCKPEGGFQEIKEHLESEHWGWQPCTQCSELVDPDKMVGHMLRKHNQYTKNIVCNDCGAAFGSDKSKDFRMHMEYHRAEKFECDCQIIFENKKAKIHHIHTVHLKELFPCDKCHTVCLTETDLSVHYKKKHLDVVDKQCPICDICGYVCKSDKPWLLRWHKERMHDPVLLQCPQCPAKLNASAMKDHLKSHNNAGVCSECGAQVQNVKRHMKARHRPQELMKYKCQYCSKAFQYSRDIKRHLMSAHLKSRPYKCRYGCDFAYNDSSNRNQHEKKKHGGIFTSKTNLPPFTNTTATIEPDPSIPSNPGNAATGPTIVLVESVKAESEQLQRVQVVTTVV